ncbi:polysaccharide biosynthesis tyrosine autokinase [Mycolicibacterium sp.]|uniref:polysaccharide biosynthesis tyrosine autokinase n=1 Tax=Mycolicibacterium sp. TaxID=2320850 RepID=UPI0037C7C97E
MSNYVGGEREGRRRSTAMEGAQLTSQDFARILRTRWKTVIATIVIAVLCAIAYALLATPQYEAKTRLFVSTTADGNATQTNDGGLFAQRRVLSYTQLLTGGILAQRTIDKLNLDMTANELIKEITAEAPTDTVLIDVTVTDPSPTRARDIANTLSDEFVAMAAALETPAGGLRPNALVVVQDRAAVPDGPVSPKKKQALTIAVALGVLLGIVIAIARDRLDRRLRTPEAVEKATGVGVLAEIPLQAQRRNQPLISFDSDHSPLAEAFRELRVNLRFLEVADGPRVIVVASSMPGEGRTTTAINLALALAETGCEVVVVDGDLRRPRVASYLGIDGQVGLSTVLSGGAALNDALRETSFPRVTVLPSGAVPTNPTELLESQAAKDVLDELGRNFDHVIVDSPSTLVNDAAILAANSQGVLVLAQYAQAKRARLAQAANILRRSGAPLLGAVLTMTPAKRRTAAEDPYYGTPAQQDSPAQGRRARRNKK